jgi:hypothetical protein
MKLLLEHDLRTEESLDIFSEDIYSVKFGNVQMATLGSPMKS